MRLYFDPHRGKIIDSYFRNYERSFQNQLTNAVRKWVTNWDNQMWRTFHMPNRAVGLRLMPGSIAPREIGVDKFEIMLLARPRYGCWRQWDALPRDRENPMVEIAMKMADMRMVEPRMLAQIALAPELLCAKPLMPPLDGPKAKPPLGKAPEFSKWRDGHQFIHKLTDRGFRQIGAGAYSTVLAKPGSDKVIKVCRQLDCWLDYVVWSARQGHAGKWAPRVYSFRRFNAGLDSEFYVAVVERMEATVSAVQKQRQNTHMAWKHLRAFIEKKSDRDGLEAEKLAPGALRFGIDFRVEFGSAGNDLHSGNFMVRPDGTLVCTDPLTSETGNSSSHAPSRMRHRDLEALCAA